MSAYAGAYSRELTRVGTAGGRHPVLAAFVVSRLVAVGSLLLGGSTHLGQPSTTGLTAWDGQWYLLIVRSGYGLPPVGHQWSRWPFFPLLPASAHVLGLLGVPPRWGLIAVANVAFVIAMWGVWRLASNAYTRRVAVIAVWTVAVAPFASIFSMAYPSSLFLAGSTWAFVFVRERRDVSAGAAAAVATLARPNGIAVVVALAVALLCAARSSPPGRDQWPVIRRLGLVCGPGAVGLAVWCAQLGRWTGNPLVFWTAKRAWYEVTAVDLVRTWPGDATVHVFVALLAFTTIALAWRQLPSAWIAFAGLYLLPSFAFGLVGLGRYAGECFPAVIAAGIVLERVPRYVVPVVLITLAGAMAVLAVVITTNGIIP